jgi:branched-chain amino acid transport system substrate-binding protein
MEERVPACLLAFGNAWHIGLPVEAGNRKPNGGVSMKRLWLVCLALMIGASLLIGVNPSAAAAADPVVLAVPTSLYTPFGRGCVKAVELAIEEINAAGGVKIGNEKRPLVAVVADTRCGEPATPVHDALMAYEKLILEKKPHAILVGAFRSEVLIAAMDMVAKYKIPHLHTIAQTPQFQKKFAEDPQKYKYLFRPTTDALVDASYINAAMEILKKQFGLENVLFIYQDTLWAQAFAGLMRKQCTEKGWKDLGFDGYAAGANDFSPALSKAKEQKAQVIGMVWDVPLGAGIFAKQYKAMKVPAVVVGFVPPLGAPDAVKTLGPGVEHTITVEFPVGASLALAKLPKTGKFLDAFKKKFGALPEAPAVNSSAYDAVYLTKEAIERAGSLDADKIVAELEKTDYAGVSGRLKFNEQHIAVFGHDDPEKTGVCTVFQWQKGADGELKRVPVYPPFLAEGEIKLPAEMGK